MFEDLTNSLYNLSFILPTKEELERLINKLNNNEDLDFYDNLVLDKIRCCNYLLKFKGGKI